MWAGISKKGLTGICIFEGIMDAPLFCEILRRTLLPFIASYFPEPGSHRLMQDNDSKHVSRFAQEFYTTSGINWWWTPAESPDINPTEIVWHELKEYRCEIKATTKEELVQGIKEFCATVTRHKCCHYINHLSKVLPKVIEKQGDATGY